MSEINSSTRQRLLLIGGGQACAQLIASMQTGLASFDTTIVSDEPHLPYQRPPLSKAFFDADFDVGRLPFKDAEFYRKAGVALRLDTDATELDRTQRLVRLANGDSLAYDVLVLATGARARTLDIPGAGLAGVMTLRTLADAQALASYMQAGKRLAVVGGGFIGLELAASASRKGMSVTLVESGHRLLRRIASPFVAQALQEMHERAGVEIFVEAQVEALLPAADAQHVGGLRLGDGRTIDADVVVLGVGAVPNSELARSAGLAIVQGAIAVDERGQTSDEHIFAIGDCSCVVAGQSGCAMRFESVPHAISQAKAVAAQLLGDAMPSATVPWFWSDQFATRLQIAGVALQYGDCVLRDMAAPKEYGARAFVEFYLEDGRVVAAAAVDRPAEFMAVRRYLDSRPYNRPDPALLADPSVPLAQALASNLA